MSMLRRFASANTTASSTGSGGGATRTPPKASRSEPTSPSPDMSPLGSMWRGSDDRDDDDDDTESVSSIASRLVNQRGSVSSHFVDQRSGFFSPPELIPPNAATLDPVAYRYWLRIGTMCRQLLLIQGRIGLKKKQGKMFHVRACIVQPVLAECGVGVASVRAGGGREVVPFPCSLAPDLQMLATRCMLRRARPQVSFKANDFVDVCQKLQVVDTQEDALRIASALLENGIITELYGTREFKYKKKIFRFACDHALLHFDGAAGGRVGVGVGENAQLNMNPAVFEPCRRFRDNPNFVVAKLHELLRHGVDSVRLLRSPTCHAHAASLLESHVVYCLLVCVVCCCGCLPTAISGHTVPRACRGLRK
jgi:hypothetical protein